MNLYTVNDIRKHFIGELNDGAYTVDKTGQKTIELIAHHFSQTNRLYSEHPIENTLIVKSIGTVQVLLTFGIFMAGTLILLKHGNTQLMNMVKSILTMVN